MSVQERVEALLSFQRVLEGEPDPLGEVAVALEGAAGWILRADLALHLYEGTEHGAEITPGDRETLAEFWKEYHGGES